MDIQNNDTQPIKDKTKQAELEFINTHFLTNNIFEDNENAKLINHIKSTIKERSNPLGFNKIAKFIKPHHNVRILVGICTQEIKDKHQIVWRENCLGGSFQQQIYFAISQNVGVAS